MTDYVTWFRTQLQSSADGFAWAFRQLPNTFHFQLPPRAHYMGSWPPIRHLWHVTEYERLLVIPSMQQWFGKPMPDGNSWDDSDQHFAKSFDSSQTDGAQGQAWVERFLDVRRQQIEMLDELTHVDWEAKRPTLWGQQPLKVVVTKTYQHTFEHADTLLRMALWWKEDADDPAAQPATLLRQSEQALQAYNLDEARTLIAQALAAYRQLGDEGGVAHAQYLEGILAYETGDYATARSRQEAALAFCRQHQYTGGVADSLKYLGLIAAKEGNIAEALAYWQESLQTYQTTGNRKEGEVVRMLIGLLRS